jgi:hypothetical protein
MIGAPQRTPEWLEARRGIPTASRFDRILTAAKGVRSAAQDGLIDELIAESLLPGDGVSLRMTADMEFGIKLEAEARCAYEMEYAKGNVTEAGFILAGGGRFGGSPDALVGEDGGVEIKCPSATTHIGYLRAGGLPNDYKCQVHGYMVVTGRAWWDFFSYHRGLPRFYLRVTRNEFTAKLAGELAQFCVRYNEERAKFGLPALGVSVAA